MKCKSISSRFGEVSISVFMLMMLLSLWNPEESAFAAQENSGNPADFYERMIENVTVTDHPESVDVLIQGNQVLTYTSVRQVAPLGLILYFSKTRLNTTENFFTPPNAVVLSVSAAEIVETSKVEIYLKKEAFYEITREGNSLRVTFSKLSGMSAAASFRNETAPPPVYHETAPPVYTAPEPADAGMTESFPKPAAPSARDASGPNHLESVYAAKFGNSLKVFVGADGMIRNYRSFVIDSPARIVFDIFNIRSPYSGEKVIPVNTPWVSQIRYYNYSDRVRVILETRPDYLNAFRGIPVENGLLIQMGDGVVADPGTARSGDGAETESFSAVSPSGNIRLQSVYTSQLDRGMLVTVRGNSPISDYRTSVTEDPPRIIVDMPGVDSPYEGENFFPVDTRWVRTVRHRKNAEGVQLIIETRPAYLRAFSARPDKNGLVVHIGEGTAVADTAPVSASLPTADRGSPASVETIDFLKEDAGKSVLIIGTGRPVPYEIAESGDRGLELKLLHTKLPDRHIRPLITDRFESAVDEIMPRRKSGNTAVFEIRLRESVPYFAEQDSGVLKVYFEASSISPKPMEAVPVITAAVPANTAPPAAAANNTNNTMAGSTVPPAVSPDLPVPSAAVPPPVTDTADDMGNPALNPAFSVDEVPQYTGEKIALDFYETDIKNVFRILREISGRNFAVDKDVTGKVTLTLAEPVPWDQVLDLVLKMNQLGKSSEGNIIRIATRKTMEEEDKLREEKRTAELTLREQKKQLEPLLTEYIPVNYSKAQTEIAPHIEKLLTKDRGSVSVDARTNMIIMTDTAEKIRQGKDLIRKLDRVTPQVIIEARIVEASQAFSRVLGTQWEMAIGLQDPGNMVSDVPADVGEFIMDRVGVGPQRGYNELGGTYGFNTAMNFPAAVGENYGSFGFSFTRVAGTPLLLNAKLQAMESQGEGKIISAPKIVTLDNKKAVIRQGLSYPYQTVEDGEVSLQFKDVDLLLEVTPHVTPDNRIAMTINITKNDLGAVISGEQSFTTKEAQTELLVNDGDTVVIGGIIKTTERQSIAGIPGLSRIPILGWFFKKEDKTHDKEELLIFITPRIVQLEQRTAQF